MWVNLTLRLWGGSWRQRNRQEIWHQTPASSCRWHEWDLYPLWQCKQFKVILVVFLNYIKLYIHVLRRHSMQSGKLHAFWPLRARLWPTAPTSLKSGTSSPSFRWRAWRPLLVKQLQTWIPWRWMPNASFHHATPRSIKPNRFVSGLCLMLPITQAQSIHVLCFHKLSTFIVSS